MSPGRVVLKKLPRFASVAVTSLAVILLVGGAGQVVAQEAPAACFIAPARLSDADVAAFLANPGVALADNPSGGLPLSSRVRSLAGSSAASVDAIISLVPTATIEQRAAIGSGLARAARACARVSPLYAAFIQEKVAGIDSPDVIAAFLAASEDVQTAALGGAGATAGGGTAAAGLGGGGEAGPFSGGLFGDTAVAQSSDTAPFNGSRSSFSVGDTVIVVSPTN